MLWKSNKIKRNVFLKILSKPDSSLLNCISFRNGYICHEHRVAKQLISNPILPLGDHCLGLGPKGMKTTPAQCPLLTLLPLNASVILMYLVYYIGDLILTCLNLILY